MVASKSKSKLMKKKESRDSLVCRREFCISGGSLQYGGRKATTGESKRSEVILQHIHTTVIIKITWREKV